MMKLAKMVLLVTCLFALAACGKGDAAAGGAAAAAAGPPVEGASCEGIGAMDSRIACDGQKIIFCSSFSSYKYAVSQVCDDDKECVVAADGKSASCE